MLHTHGRMPGAPLVAEAPRVLGIEEVASIGRLVHRRLYLSGHHPQLGRPITGQTGPETVVEVIGVRAEPSGVVQ